MNFMKSPKERLSLLLWLIAVHSFFVGLGLIIQLPFVMEFMGYGICNEPFFPAQGGVFHIIMALGYALAASDLDRYECLVIFSILVKGLATLFLLIYYFAFEQIWSIIMSGIVDGLMMVAILLGWMSYSRSVCVSSHPAV